MLVAQCLFQCLDLVTYICLGLAFCRAVLRTFICTKENFQDLTKMPFYNLNVGSVSLLASPFISLSCTREIQFLQG